MKLERVVDCFVSEVGSNIFSTLKSLKAIGTNFKILAASELNEDYRAFFLANHPGRFEHVYRSLDDQLQGETCILCHENGLQCTPTGRTPTEEIHLLITGSPCDPFSVQRGKRWASGSVKDHSDFGTTMGGVIKAYSTYEPFVGILEQVLGFTMPFEAGGSSTPLSRQGQTKQPGQINIQTYILDCTSIHIDTYTDMHTYIQTKVQKYIGTLVHT